MIGISTILCGCSSMAKVEFSELEAYAKDLANLTPLAVDGICKETVYAGVKVVADAIKADLQTRTAHKNPVDGMTETERKALMQGLGTSAHFNTDGDWTGKIGFAGYYGDSTKKWPKGVPVPLTARSLISGTSWRVKDNFITRPVNKAKQQAQEEMGSALESAISKRLKGGQ